MIIIYMIIIYMIEMHNIYPYRDPRVIYSGFFRFSIVN